MTIYATSLKLYQCTNWSDSATQGGDINTSATITSDTDQNIFDNVTNSERESGTTDYRKIFFRNENADVFNYVHCWIDSNTPATNDMIYVRPGGSKSLRDNSAALTGSATFTNGATYVWTSADLTSEIMKGEFVFNSTDDSSTSAASIDTIGATYIWLATNYTGTSGSGKSIQVASITHTGGTWFQPASKEDTTVLLLGSLAQNEYSGVWVKRVVAAAGDGYDGNKFTLAFENATA